MKARLSSLRLAGLLLAMSPLLCASTCGSSDPAPSTPTTPQTVELRYTVAGTADASGNGPQANLRVYKSNGAGVKDSLLFNSESTTGWGLQIPDGTYKQTLTRRFKPGETFIVRTWYRYSGHRPLKAATNLHVEAWSGTTQLGTTDLGYADRNNTALYVGTAPDQDLVRNVTVTLP